MKKSLLVISVILLIAGLFISCNSEAAGSEEDLVYVTFEDEGKGLSTEIAPYGGSSVTPISDLYWYYTATKNGGAQQGATDSWKRVNENGKGLSGTLGPFSVGSWTFTLKGCSDEEGNTIVYNGTTGDTPVKLKRGTNYINVTLSWQNAPVAPTTTRFDWNVTYSADYSGTLYYRVTAKVGTTVTTLNDSNNNSATIANGSISISGSKDSFSITDEFTPITVKFEVYSEAPDTNSTYDEDVKVAEGSVTFPGLKGGTATISGTLDDLGSAYVVINEPSTPAGISASKTNNVDSETVAYIIKGDTMYGYASLNDAIEAASTTSIETVGLLKDVGSAEQPKTSVYTITKSLTIDGNNHSLYVGTSSPSDSAINITESNVSVSLNYINIYSTTMERAVQIGKQDGSSVANVVLNINHSELHANTNGGNTYTLNVRPGTVNAHINIIESTIEGSAAMNIWGTGHAISVNNSTLTGNNKMAYTTTRGYNGNDFGVVVFEGESSSSYATSVNVNLTKCILNASSENQNAEDLILFNPYSSGNGVTITDCTMTYDIAANQDTEGIHWISAHSNTNNNTVSVSGGSLNSSTPSIVEIDNGTNNSFTVSNQ